MDKRRFSRMLMVPLISVLALTMVATTACTPEELQTLNGMLQNVDSANGKITIVTKDGQTVTIKLDKDTALSADGGTTNASSLAPGAEVEVKVKKDKDGQVASEVKAKQAQVEGNITKIESGNVTIQPEKGNPVMVVTSNTTRIEQGEEHAATLADLKVGLRVHAKYDPTTKQAFKIEIQGKEQENENQGKGKGNAEIGSGIVEIRVTDPPPANVKSAVVYISNIEVHKAIAGEADNTTATDNSSGWIPITTNVTSFDLMDVIGVEKVLGSTNLSAGKYTQIRMSVTNVTGVTTDNVSYTAEVPGDKLKIVGPFNVDNGGKTVLTLDFDGEKSLIQTGDGKFLFKPVVKLLIDNSGKGNLENRGESENKGKPETTANTTDLKGEQESGGKGKGND